MGARKVYRTELTPVHFLQRSAAVFPDRVAVVHGGRRLTYRELAERAFRLGSALREAGLNDGDRVAYVCPNTPAMLEGKFGVPAAGGVLVPVNIRLAPAEVGYILEHSGARFVIVDHELAGLVEGAKGVEVIVDGDTGEPGDAYEQFLRSGSPSFEPVPVADEEEPISINYTSGTTGRPKGVDRHPSRAGISTLSARSSRRVSRRLRLPVGPADVPLQRLVLPLGGDRRRPAATSACAGSTRRTSGS